jgi:hypothetical protein
MSVGFAWLIGLSSLPMLYWAALPSFDPEYSRFAAANKLPLYSPVTALVSFGLGSAALLGIPRLLRGTAYPQMLGCFALALAATLYVPAYPWRSHLLYLSPVLVIAAIAAWWPILANLRRRYRWILVGGSLAVAVVSAPFYYSRNIDSLMHPMPPSFLTTDDVQAINWLAHQPGEEVVLARADVSPWVAAWGRHRVVVGHYLWTHEYAQRLGEVQAVFEQSADPRPLLRGENVAWILVDEERGTPACASSVEPAARFGQTVVLRSQDILRFNL